MRRRERRNSDYKESDERGVMREEDERRIGMKIME